MILTQKVLEKYKGAKVEIQNPGEDCVHSGTVKDIYIEGDDELHIVFASFMRGNCDLQFPLEWRDKDRLHCVAIFGLFHAERTGWVPGKIECGTLVLTAILDGHGQKIVLHPPEVHRVIPVQAEGHQFAQA